MARRGVARGSRPRRLEGRRPLSSEREADQGRLPGTADGLATRAASRWPATPRRAVYERLHQRRRATCILMDQPPAAGERALPAGRHATTERRAAGYNAMARLAAGRVDAFVAAAVYLRPRGLSAPDILAADAGAGLAVLEDLGDGLFARLIEAAGRRGAALRRRHRRPGRSCTPSAAAGAGSGDGVLAAADLRRPGAADRRQTCSSNGCPSSTRAGRSTPRPWPNGRRSGRRSARAARPGATVFCHRDYHAENLIWLPDREGAARVGLLDFQDAVRAHPAWDLSMLLQDARRDVSPELRGRGAGPLSRRCAPSVDQRGLPGRLPRALAPSTSPGSSASSPG